MKHWRKAENDPKGLDVKRVGGSGSGTIKGDQIGEDVMVEVKTTVNLSFPISLELILKVKEQASSQGKMPVIRIDLSAGYKDEETVAVLPWATFLLLLEAANAAN